MKEIREALESCEAFLTSFILWQELGLSEVTMPKTGELQLNDAKKQLANIKKALSKLDELEKENEWQPIETAPTDRDILVLCANGFVMVAGWHFKRKEWYNPTCAKGRCILLPITHWKPLPQHPKEE